MSVRVFLDPTDCVERARREYFSEVQNKAGTLFRNLEDPTDRFEVRHSDMHAFLRREDVRLRRGHFSKSRKLLSLRTAQRFFSSAPVRDRMRATYKLTWVQRYLQMEAEGSVNRTEVSIADYFEELHQGVKAQLLAELVDQDRSLLDHKPPSPRTLLQWVRNYERGGHNVLALLRKERAADTYAQRFNRETVKIINSKLWEYLQDKRKSMRGVAKDIVDHFKELNEARENDGLDALRPPSIRELERRMKRFSAFATKAGRHGGAAAKRDMAIHTGGRAVHQPMELLQMDEWQFDVLSIFDDAGCLEGMSSEEKQALNIGRRWGYFVIDVATRCIVGFRLSATQDSRHSIDALSFATIDKTHLAEAAGCESKWNQHGGGSVVATDMGPAFIATRYLTAASDAGFTPQSAAAGVPKLRGHVERVFGTFASQLMPELTGRVFFNTRERGEYPSEKRAALTDDDLVWVFIRFIVDIYHNTPHGGLDLETPANAWKRLEAEQGVMPPPDATTRRVAFGIEATCMLDRHGVRFLGNFYQSGELQEAYLRHGAHEVTLKVDQGDITHVSVCLDNDWHSAKAISETAWGLTLEQWQEMTRQILAKHKTAALVTEGIARRARKDIRSVNSDAMTRRRLKPKIFDADELKRLERNLFLGIEIKPARLQEPEIKAPRGIGLLGDTIPAKPTQAPTKLAPTFPQPQKMKLEFHND